MDPFLITTHPHIHLPTTPPINQSELAPSALAGLGLSLDPEREKMVSWWFRLLAFGVAMNFLSPFLPG